MVCYTIALVARCKLHLHPVSTPIYIRGLLSPRVHERPSGTNSPFHFHGHPVVCSFLRVVVLRCGQCHLDHSGIHTPPVPFPSRLLPPGSPNSSDSALLAARCASLFTDGPVSKQDWSIDHVGF